MAQQAQPGRVVGGRYELVKALHTGGFGRVWQARDRRRHSDVAVKEVWLPPTISDAERLDRLTRADREARSAIRLRHHPNIVSVLDVVTEDGIPWIVMQLVTGHSLAEDLSAAGPLTAAQVRYVADSLLKALGAAHGAGIVHRDVKPANVMFNENGAVLLTDFGIAVQETDSTLTATGMIVGSIDYMAPERIRAQDSKAASDVFSLGVTLYQAATGVSPFHRDTTAASLAAILFDDPKPPACDPGLSKFIMRLLTKDPKQRPTVPVARGLLAAMANAPATLRTRQAPKRTATVPVGQAPKRPTPTKVDAKHPVPTKVASPPQAVQPPQRRRRRQARSVVLPTPEVRRRRQARRIATPPPPPARRRVRRGSGISFAALVVLGLIGLYAGWGRDAAGATSGDCVYNHQQGWHLEPCALPIPWRDAANYRVLERIVGTSAQCDAIPGWTAGDDTTVLPGTPPVTLCLAPVTPRERR